MAEKSKTVQEKYLEDATHLYNYVAALTLKEAYQVLSKLDKKLNNIEFVKLFETDDSYTYQVNIGMGKSRRAGLGVLLKSWAQGELTLVQIVKSDKFRFLSCGEVYREVRLSLPFFALGLGILYSLLLPAYSISGVVAAVITISLGFVSFGVLFANTMKANKRSLVEKDDIDFFINLLQTHLEANDNQDFSITEQAFKVNNMGAD